MVIGMSEDVSDPKSGSNGGKPDTNELCAEVGSDELRDSKNAPLVLSIFVATAAAVSPLFLAGIATIQPECRSTHTTTQF